MKFFEPVGAFIEHDADGNDADFHMHHADGEHEKDRPSRRQGGLHRRAPGRAARVWGKGPHPGPFENTFYYIVFFLQNDIWFTWLKKVLFEAFKYFF